VSILPTRWVANINRQLISAGSPMSAQAFFTIVLLMAIGFPLATGFLILQTGGELSFIIVVMLGVLAFCGFILPVLWLRRAVRNRKTAIWRRLPDAFDMITVCVEAGLGLDAALRQVSTKLKGPLADEIALTLRQVGMGRPRREALEDMADRIDVSEVTTFVNAVIQAEQLGTSLGRVLRAQSFSLRVARRQRAEEIARRAPIKMVFPLVLFIMPAFFIVTVGPMVIHFVDYLGG
jgi:tight adherence protein C